MKNKTQRALDLMRDNPGMSAYAAAKAVDMSQSVLSRAIKARKEKNRCPHCGAIIRDEK
jgi:hypothetical protein